jgi:hypothetical protein
MEYEHENVKALIGNQTKQDQEIRYKQIDDRFTKGDVHFTDATLQLFFIEPDDITAKETIEDVIDQNKDVGGDTSHQRYCVSKVGERKKVIGIRIGGRIFEGHI